MTPILFKLDCKIGKKPNKKQESLKVKIKIQLGDTNIKIIFIFIITFRVKISEALLKLLVILKKILTGNNIKSGLH